MAVTDGSDFYLPIKGRVDKVINYARNPEKTTEQAHDELAAMHSIDGVV